MFEKFKSRKFIFAVAGAIALFVEGQYDAAAAVIVAWFAAEGALDWKGISARVDEFQTEVEAAEFAQVSQGGQVFYPEGYGAEEQGRERFGF